MGRIPPRRRWAWMSCLALIACVPRLAGHLPPSDHPSQTGGRQLVRIVPDESIPIGPDGVTGPAVNADCRFVQITAGHNVYVYDRREGSFALASQSMTGQPADSHSAGMLPSGGRLSDDGRMVVFTSLARDLVPGDRGYENDIFARDLRSGQTVKLSRSRSDRASRLSSGGERVSGDGRVTAFQSMADDLVSGDTNAFIDVFVHDLATREITLVSVSGSGVQANGPAKTPALDARGRLGSCGRRRETSRTVIHC